MYELKKFGKEFTSKFVGIGPSSYEKRIYRAVVSTDGERHCSALLSSVQCLAARTEEFFSFIRRSSPQWARASSFTWFLHHTQRRTTVGRTPLDEWSARRRDFYLTTLTTHKYTCPPVGFEPTISAGERLQTYALDRGSTGTGVAFLL
jgi:hypothetical protein